MRTKTNANHTAPEGNHSANVRTGLSVADLKQAFLDNLFCGLGRVPTAASRNDAYTALALTVRDRLFKQGVRTMGAYAQQSARVVAYLSAEFLPGPHLANNLLSLGLTDNARQAMAELGMDLDELIEQEEEPGLGNGGLGRLASCFLDSLATLQVPAIGYGIRYDFGMFEQKIEGGRQVEQHDNWLSRGNTWELPRYEDAQTVRFGGRVIFQHDRDGRLRADWVDTRAVIGLPYDSFIVGHRTDTANTLRLWAARATRDFNLQFFNEGDFRRAVEEKIDTENISKVLYPNDHSALPSSL